LPGFLYGDVIMTDRELIVAALKAIVVLSEKLVGQPMKLKIETDDGELWLTGDPTVLRPVAHPPTGSPEAHPEPFRVHSHR
jgi:hypothetical protein